jgi:phospholipid/cholesterol/gamma-HCH transport system substrate-binding protein
VNNTKTTIGFSLFAVFTLILTWIIWSTLERPVNGDTRTYSVVFQDASGLMSADDVRIAGVRVGRVKSVSLDGNDAKVTFEVQKNQPVYSNTQAAIKYQNLIGQRYLRLTLACPGSNPDNTAQGHQTQCAPGEKIKSGGKLDSNLVENSFDISGLLVQFQPVFDTLTPEEINKLTGSIVQTLDGDGVDISYLVRAAGEVASNLGTHDQLVGSIINNLSQVTGSLVKQNDQLKSVLTGAAGVVNVLNTNSATFGKAVVDIGNTASGLADLLSQTRPNLVGAVNNLRSGTNTLLGSAPKIASLGKNTPSLLGYLARTMGDGAWLSLYQCDLDISIGNVLFPPGLINQIGGSAHSAVCR